MTDAELAIEYLDELKENYIEGEGYERHPLPEYYAIVTALKALEQEPKTGHWIEHPEIKTSTPEYLMFYECSECGDKHCFCKSDIHKKHFCNNCGARMNEPQEREDI